MASQRQALAGRLIFEVHPQAIRHFEEAIPFARFARQKKRQIKTGVPALDKALRSLDIQGIRRLFDRRRTSPTLDRCFLIDFDPDISLVKASRLLKAHKAIAHCEPDYVRKLLDSPIGLDQTSMSQVLNQIRWPEAFATDANIDFPAVAIVDSGIADPRHPLLPTAYSEQWDTVDVNGQSPPGDFQWWSPDLVNPDDRAVDEIGHGTHLAGIVAGHHTGSFGGVAPLARVIPIRAMAKVRSLSSGQTEGFGTASNIATAIQLARQRGASVINLSFGFERNSTMEQKAIDLATANGMVVVAAIGNGGGETPALRPAVYKNVIAVGAVDSRFNRWPDSQTGKHLFIMAPGVDISSTGLGPSMVAASGTSMACAVVSGVVALMKAKNPNLNTSAIAKILAQTAMRPAGTAWNKTTGWGVVDAQAAVNLA